MNNVEYLQSLIRSYGVYGTSRLIVKEPTRRTISTLKEDIFASKAIKDFFDKKKGINSLTEAYDFVNNWKFRGITITPFQVKEHLVEFSKMVQEFIGMPQFVVEIGTGEGGNLFLLSQISSLDATIVSVDRRKFSRGRIKLFKSFNCKQNIVSLKVNTFSPSFIELIKTVLGGNEPDLIFIDGDHTYKGVKKRFLEIFFNNQKWWNYSTSRYIYGS